MRVIRRVYSSLAQSVEHLTVNQGVAGSSPAGGAKTETGSNRTPFFVLLFLLNLRFSYTLRSAGAQGKEFHRNSFGAANECEQTLSHGSSPAGGATWSLENMCFQGFFLQISSNLSVWVGVNHVFLINNLRTVVHSLRWISVYFFILKKKTWTLKRL